MLRKFCASLFALCLVFLATPLPSSAQVAGTVGGTYKFIMDDEISKYLEFNATSTERGGATGYMIFNDDTKVFIQDPDGEPVKGEGVAFTMKADLDSMIIEKNRALMSGVVRDSSVREYIGRFVQLVIEDNDGVETPDKFVWQFCTPEPGGWIPSDAEWKDDQGAFMSWWSTDAERRDDVGIPSPNLIPGLKACRAQSLQSYTFAEILKGDGSITIKQ